MNDRSAEAEYAMRNTHQDTSVNNAAGGSAFVLTEWLSRNTTRGIITFHLSVQVQEVLEIGTVTGSQVFHIRLHLIV